MLERFKSGADKQAKAEERVRRKLAEQQKKSSKLLTIFCSSGPNPLKGWGVACYGGLAQVIKDHDAGGKQVVEMRGQVIKNSIWSPLTRKDALDINLPIVYFLIKHIRNYVVVDIEAEDDSGRHRHLRASNFQNCIVVHKAVCCMPLRIEAGWNRAIIDIRACFRQAFGAVYRRTIRVKVCGNCRLLRIFFCDRPKREERLPPEYRLGEMASAGGTYKEI